MSWISNTGLAVGTAAVVASWVLLLNDGPDVVDDSRPYRPVATTSPSIEPVTPDEPTASQTAGEVSRPGTVLVLGDSVATRSGAEKRWTKVLRDDLDIRIDNRARGGAGYVTDGTPDECDLDRCPSMSGMARVAIRQDADAEVVLVVGGIADVGTPGVEQDIADFYQGIRANFPDARIIATAPLVLGGDAPDGLEAYVDVVAEQVERVDGTLLDVGQPYLDASDLPPLEQVDAGGAVLARAVVDALVADYGL